ncbi:hypothetical protein L198_07272 [Cryptococcus wingfieldii CBS 7118]|uniref:Uncharacterized protein n=1 Tax=Cryptococcus wingfieldii CBS 7118 TaxID=1295528 RepID=A0A1E3IDL0_9TREE|nr:hypothetical protein L198_07272 [Cryptococcus wingfieldii CBS 7118]ODN86578.1 hypothetical protein L198_07272 [Cryptococcus wingfieldii CBS 7118]
MWEMHSILSSAPAVGVGSTTSDVAGALGATRAKDDVWLVQVVLMGTVGGGTAGGVAEGGECFGGGERPSGGRGASSCDRRLNDPVYIRYEPPTQSDDSALGPDFYRSRGRLVYQLSIALADVFWAPTTQCWAYKFLYVNVPTRAAYRKSENNLLPKERALVSDFRPPLGRSPPPKHSPPSATPPAVPPPTVPIRTTWTNHTSSLALVAPKTPATSEVVDPTPTAGALDKMLPAVPLPTVPTRTTWTPHPSFFAPSS